MQRPLENINEAMLRRAVLDSPRLAAFLNTTDENSWQPPESTQKAADIEEAGSSHPVGANQPKSGDVAIAAGELTDAISPTKYPEAVTTITNPMAEKISVDFDISADLPEITPTFPHDIAPEIVTETAPPPNISPEVAEFTAVLEAPPQETSPAANHNTLPGELTPAPTELTFPTAAAPDKTPIYAPTAQIDPLNEDSSIERSQSTSVSHSRTPNRHGFPDEQETRRTTNLFWGIAALGALIALLATIILTWPTISLILGLSKPPVVQPATPIPTPEPTKAPDTPTSAVGSIGSAEAVSAVETTTSAVEAIQPPKTSSASQEYPGRP